MSGTSQDNISVRPSGEVLYMMGLQKGSLPEFEAVVSLHWPELAEPSMSSFVAPPGSGWSSKG